MLLDVPPLLNLMPASVRCVAEGMSSHGNVRSSSSPEDFVSTMLLDVLLLLNLIPVSIRCVAEGMCFRVDVRSFSSPVDETNHFLSAQVKNMFDVLARVVGKRRYGGQEMSIMKQPSITKIFANSSGLTRRLSVLLKTLMTWT
jgi:hypothetical protein